MMTFLKSILSACVAGLKAFGRAATWPLRALIGGGGGGMPALEAVAEDAALDPTADREAAMATGAAMAELVLAWAANSIIDDAPAHLPDVLTDELKSWARGLSREECECILEAEEHAISAHIQGVFLLPGVRRVQPLPTADWGHARTQTTISSRRSATSQQCSRHSDAGRVAQAGDLDAQRSVLLLGLLSPFVITLPEHFGDLQRALPGVLVPGVGALSTHVGEVISDADDERASDQTGPRQGARGERCGIKICVRSTVDWHGFVSKLCVPGGHVVCNKIDY
jgi:hypothetical protein